MDIGMRELDGAGVSSSSAVENGEDESSRCTSLASNESDNHSLLEMRANNTNLSDILDAVPSEDAESTMTGAGILSKEALAEQAKLEKKIMGQEEARKRKEEKKKVDQEMLEKRYERLLDLLQKSQLYSEFLAKKIADMKTLPSPVKKAKNPKGKENARTRSKGLKLSAIPESANVEPADETAPALTKTRSLSFEECKKKQPSLLENVTMRPYQLEGYEWLKSLTAGGLSGILADEMGLGKTLQCIANICSMIERGVTGPYLIIAPLSTLPNWVNEFKQFAPKVPTILYHGPYQTREELAEGFKKMHNIDGLSVYPVVITSYELVINDVKVLAAPVWKYLVIDEGHRIKNYQSRLSRELKKYQSVNRLLLTGTPLQNDLTELWALLNFLMPEIFDDLDVFQSWFDLEELHEGNSEVIEREKSKHVIQTLHKILHPFLLRRVKSDVEIDLPPKKELIVYCPMAASQAEMYSAIVEKTIFSYVKKDGESEDVELNEHGRPKRKSHDRSYKNYFDTEGTLENKIDSWIQMSDDYEEVRAAKLPKSDGPRTSLVRIKMQNPMMMLRKCVNHPFLCDWPMDANGETIVDERIVSESGKMQVLDQMLGRLKKVGHKVLIFSQMTMMMDILEDFLTLRGHTYLRLDGSTKLKERGEAMRAFNKDPDVFVFLLSTRAGGLGINLTGGDTVVIYDSDWNPQVDLQAQDRCHRIGQTKPVVVYRYVTAGTVDQRVVERAAAKRRLEKMIIQRGKFRQATTPIKKGTSVEELMELLKAKDYQGEYGKAKHDAVFTEKEWKALLDRSDLMPNAKEHQEVEGVFKRIDAEEVVM